MTRNLGRIDQYLRIVIGFALLAYVVKDGTLAFVSFVPAIVGLVLVTTAFLSYCPLYAALGVTTRRKLDLTA